MLAQTQRLLHTCLAALISVAIGMASPVYAQSGRPQPETRKWEVQFHGGFGFATNPTDGSGELPPGQGEFDVPGFPRSRIIPSWFYGIGTDVLNGPVGTVGGPRLQSVERAVATIPGGERRRGGAFGVRLARHLTSVITAEVSVDYQPGALRVSQEAVGVLRDAADSFPPTWNAFFAAVPPVFVDPSTSADLTLSDDGGGQIVTAGTLNFNLQPQGRIRPYLSIGGGVAAHRGGTATATLRGRYSFTGADVLPIEQTDTLTVRYAPGDRTFVTVLGAGLRADLGPAWGLRADIRANLGSDRRTVTLDATPATTGTPPGFVVVQILRTFSFSTSPALRSTLSGSVSDFESFRASGRFVHTNITIGVFRRF